MPDNCNALLRLDKTKDFCKVNCKWGSVPIGRPRAGTEKRQGKSKRIRIKNPHTICISIERAHFDYIKSQAIKRSQETGEIVQPNDLIREGLQRAFPCPKLFDMFGGVK